MTTRTASLQVSHSSWCPNKTRTALSSVDKGCQTAKCRPRYYTLHRVEGPDGRPVKERGERFSDRREAEKELRRLQVDIDNGRAGWTAPKEDITLRAWSSQFEEIVQRRIDSGGTKQRTLEGYMETLTLYALPTIGNKPLRQIGATELRTFYDATAKTTIGQRASVSSRIRHLKHLSVVLAEATDEENGLLDTNPVPSFKRKLMKKENVRLPKRGKAPFDDGELVRLWSVYRAKLAQRKKPWRAVYFFATWFMVETGLRVGEAVALDLHSLRGTDLRVMHTLSPTGLVAPKDREPRTVYLTSESLAILAEWLPIRGDAPGPLFPTPEGGRLLIREVQRKFEKAMELAGIEKLHPDSGLPRSLHSLRYTTSVLMQRRGHHPRFVEQTLGHSSLELSLNLYGGWSAEQMREEAARTA